MIPSPPSASRIALDSPYMPVDDRTFPTRARNPIDGAEHEVRPVRPHPSFSAGVVVECVDTGMMWTEPKPTDEELASLYAIDYNAAYGRDLSEGAPDPPFIRRRAAAQVTFIDGHAPSGALSETTRVVEVGAGWGALSAALVDRLPEASFTCYELDPESVRRINDADNPVTCVLGVLGVDDEVTDGSIDLLCSSHVLEHVPDAREALTSWVRCLAPGGLIFIEIPHENPVPQWWGRDPLKPYWVGHLSFFDKAKATAMLESLGCEVLASAYYDGPASEGFVMPGATELYSLPEDVSLDTAVSTEDAPRIIRILARRREP